MFSQTLPLTARQKILLGGAGALTPIVLNLLVVDASTVLKQVTLIVILGYLLKVIGLFYLGGITAALHQRERDPLRLFELGIVAPALLTATLNGARSERPAELPPNAESAVSAMAWLLPSVLGAQPPRAYSFQHPPPETIAQQFLRGLLGATPRGPWFVCVRPANVGLDDATRRLGDLQRQGVAGRIYKADGGPSGSGGAGYTVVVGDWMSEDAALKVLQRLRAQGISDAFTWAPSRN